MPNIKEASIKAKIRTRLSVIEKNAARYISSDRINQIKEYVWSQLNISDISSGVVKPKMYNINNLKSLQKD